jgi:hypothetical protein
MNEFYLRGDLMLRFVPSWDKCISIVGKRVEK